MGQHQVTSSRYIQESPRPAVVSCIMPNAPKVNRAQPIVLVLGLGMVIKFNGLPIMGR